MHINIKIRIARGNLIGFPVVIRGGQNRAAPTHEEYSLTASPMALHVVRLGTPRLRAEGVRIGTVRRPPRGVRKEDFAALDYFDVLASRACAASRPGVLGTLGSVDRQALGYLRPGVPQANVHA